MPPCVGNLCLKSNSNMPLATPLTTPWLCSEHDLGAKDVFLQKTPISFDVSVRELFFPFSVGAELVFAVPGGHRDTAYLAEVIAKRGITCCSFVPSQLEVFLQVRCLLYLNPIIFYVPIINNISLYNLSNSVYGIYK